MIQRERRRSRGVEVLVFLPQFLFPVLWWSFLVQEKVHCHVLMSLKGYGTILNKTTCRYFLRYQSINQPVVNFLTIHMLSLLLMYFVLIMVYWRTLLIRGEYCVMKSWKSCLMLKPSKDSQLQSSLLFTFWRKKSELLSSLVEFENLLRG